MAPRLRFVVTAWAALASLTRAEDVKVEVGPNVQVSSSRRDSINYYVTVAADPADASQLLTGANIWDDPTKDDGVHVAVYRSSDGGKTWVLSHEAPKRDKGTSDTTIAFGKGGNAYLSYMNVDRGWYLLHSSDAGRTWDKPTVIDANIDRPFLAVDNTSGQYSGRVYCNALLFEDPLGGTGGSLNALALYHSSDRGRTLERPVTRVARPPFYMSGDGNSVVLTDGTVVILYGYNTNKWNEEVKKRNPAHKPKGDSVLGIAVSDDGGRTFQRKTRVITTTRTAPRWHGEVYGMLAVDPGSKKFKDRLYVAWTHFEGNQCRVMLSSSTNRGDTWSKPVIVDDRPADPSIEPFDALMPAVAVNKDGVVAVTWHDTRGVKANNGWNIRLRASSDGGATWCPSVRVSSVTTDFNGKLVPGTQLPEGIGPKSAGNDAPGHTAGLTADANGRFHSVWVDNRTGVRQVWTARISVTP